MAMKRYLNWLGIALASVAMASCNLFIDDDTVNEMGFENVPVHNGEGYDEPVTVQDGDATVTYQYKKNVRVVKPEDQQWVISTQRDPTNGVILIYYRLDTPSDLLPVAGEILVSTITDKFEWGCNHLVLKSEKLSDSWAFIAMYSPLENTYEELILDGNITTFEKKTVYAEPDLTVADVDEDGYTVVDSTDNGKAEVRAAYNTHRASIVDQMKVDFFEDGFDINMPLNFDIDVEFPNDLAVNINTEGTEANIKTTYNLDGFDLKKGNFKVGMTQTIDLDLKTVIKGGWSGNKRLMRFSPVAGEVVKIHAVVLVFFMDCDLILEGEVNASFTIEKHFRDTATYSVDFKKMKATRKQNEKDSFVEGPGLESVIIDGKIGLFLKTDIGMGFYGKILAVKFTPKWGIELSCVMPLYVDSGSERIYDIGEETGLTFSFPLTVNVLSFLDVSLRGLIESEINMMDAVKEMHLLPGGGDKPLEYAQKVMSWSLEYYDSMVENNATEFNPNKISLNIDDIESDDDPELENPLMEEMGPYYPIDDIHFSWFPTMAKKSFKVVKYWDEELKEMAFKGEFKCLGIGFLGGMGVKYVPALKIYNGSEYLNTVWCDEGGKSADIKEGETYHFTIKGTTENDVMYTAVPCYYGRPLGMKQNPDALDKGLTFSATSPSIAISDVNPWRVDYGLSFADKTYYDYTFYIDVLVAMRGSLTVQKWGLEYYLGSNVTPATYDYNAKKDQKLADGTYKLKFKFEVQDATKNPYSVKIRFVPYYYGGTGTGGRHRGSEYAIKVYSNGYYRLIDPETKKEGDKIKFEAPPKHDAGGGMGPTLEPDDDFPLEDALKDGRIKMTLESIERMPASPSMVI